jgi:hypothetical protein
VKTMSENGKRIVEKMARERFSYSAIARELWRRGEPCGHSTIWRWSTRSGVLTSMERTGRTPYARQSIRHLLAEFARTLRRTG